MFKVGDVVKVKGGPRWDRYKVINVLSDGGLTLRNIEQTSQSKNFNAEDF